MTKRFFVLSCKKIRLATGDERFTAAAGWCVLDNGKKVYHCMAKREAYEVAERLNKAAAA